MIDDGCESAGGWGWVGMPGFLEHYFVFEVGQARALDFVELFELLADVGVLEGR